MSGKIKVAMIGAGGIARMHVEGLSKFADVDLVGHAGQRLDQAQMAGLVAGEYRDSHVRISRMMFA